MQTSFSVEFHSSLLFSQRTTCLCLHKITSTLRVKILPVGRQDHAQCMQSKRSSEGNNWPSNPQYQPDHTWPVCIYVLEYVCACLPLCLPQPQLISLGTTEQRNRSLYKESIWVQCLKNPPELKLHIFFQLANSKYLWTEHFLSGRKERSVCVSPVDSHWGVLIPWAFASFHLSHHPLKAHLSDIYTDALFGSEIVTKQLHVKYPVQEVGGPLH